jgi:hypothetical protein
MKTPTLLPASTCNGIKWLAFMAAALVLAGCSGAAPRGPSAEPLLAGGSFQTVHPEPEWPVRHHRHPELGKCLVTPEATTAPQEATSDSRGNEARRVDGPTSDIDSKPMCGATRP